MSFSSGRMSDSSTDMHEDECEDDSDEDVDETGTNEVVEDAERVLRKVPSSLDAAFLNIVCSRSLKIACLHFGSIGCTAGEAPSVVSIAMYVTWIW